VGDNTSLAILITHVFEGHHQNSVWRKIEVLSKRYEHDGIPLLQLNNIQIEMKDQIDRKVSDGAYQFEEVSCCICSSKEFEALATKDRYGLYMPVVICKQCGLIQTNPRMDQISYNEFYNIEYRKLYVGTETPTQKFFTAQYSRGQRIFDYLMSNKVLPKPPNQLLVFEVGCGAGGILQYFKEQGCRISGIDLGEEYVEFGKSHYGLELSVGTISEFYLNETPDLIIYSHVLEHILTPNEELQQIYRILSDEGVVYIEVPGVKNLMHNYEMDFLRMLQNAHTYHFTLTSLNSLMRKNRFEMVVGTENIHSAFRKKNTSKTIGIIESDYPEVLQYLRKVERLRVLFPIPPYRVKSMVKSRLKKALKTTGLYNLTRNIYGWFQEK